MKRKVKFQTGGEVASEAAPRSGYSRMRAEAKARQATERAAAQRYIERINALYDVEQFNQRPEVQEANRRTTSAAEARRMPVPAGGGSGPPALPPSSNVPAMPEGGGRGMVPYREPGVPATRPGAGVPAAPGGAMVPRPGTDFSGMMREGLSASGRPPMSSRLPPLATIGRALPLVGGAMAALEPTSLQEGADFERRRLQQARDEAAAAAPTSGERQLPVDRGERQLPPRPRPQARPARPRESDLTTDILNDLSAGVRVPTNQAERIALINMERRRAENAAQPYKKGGMVKPKAAPKKMMKGGVVAKPKAAAKKGKPMPAFKKGGPVKKAKGGMIGKGCK
jgi:hypothetical protein